MSVDPETLRARFDAPAPLTVGVEEELFLLDPSTLDLAPRARDVLAALGDDSRFTLELPAAQLEIVLPPAGTAGEANGTDGVIECPRLGRYSLAFLAQLSRYHFSKVVDGGFRSGAPADPIVKSIGFRVYLHEVFSVLVEEQLQPKKTAVSNAGMFS